MLALQALCAYEALGEAFTVRLLDFLRDPETHEDLGFEQTPTVETIHFAHQIALGAWQRRATLDERLRTAAAHWSVSRMTPVDRNILRLGLHELLDEAGTPPQVVINEAVELAHVFGDRDSPAFVNGVLDALRRSSEKAPARSDDGAV